jgi:hypothetical protein
MTIIVVFCHILANIRQNLKIFLFLSYFFAQHRPFLAISLFEENDIIIAHIIFKH